ncbi:MAG TPA: hypothetical protein VN326_14475 [Casimicrobiaceae bacterium]|jgi:hypothetical protein|nr:hypothetical protein [Casimicrobiaceae bacterium]
MGRSELLILACGIAGGMIPGAHAAGIQAMPAQPEVGRIEPGPPVQGPVPGDNPVLIPTTIEYQWILRVPVVSIEHRRIAVTAPSVTMRWKHWNYEIPAFRDQRIMLWKVPEFSCKYPDLILPNECRTVWRAVYVDVPVLVSEHAHVDIDLPQLGLTEQFIDVEIPRWTWTEKSFRFSLPAIAPPESIEQLRTALNDQRAALVAATDEPIANITREIEAVQARGEDPAKLVSDAGPSLDLLAQRQSLLDQRAEELDRLAAIDAELTLLSTRR